MYDAVLGSSDVVDGRSHILNSLDLQAGSYLLATIHRPSNTDNGQNLSDILAALNEIGEKIVFPAHPRTRRAIARTGRQLSSEVRLLDPVSYLDMLALERGARMIITDSGGVQKEAYLFGVPCLTLREETEWVETIEAGWNMLVEANKSKIILAAREFRPRGERPQIFGDGKASQKIVHLLESCEGP